MSSTRRDFLGRLGAGAALVAGGTMPAGVAAAQDSPRPVSDRFDMSWVGRIQGRFRAVFDSPKAEEGGEIFRAAIWKDQVRQVYAAGDGDVTSVLVIRHAGIPLAMNSAFWARHQIGKTRKLKDPATGKPYLKNPIESFAGEKDIPELIAGASLEAFQQRGGIVLACDFAFGLMVALERGRKEEDPKGARARALEYLVPGIILQPSGFFALLEAQRAGAHLFAAGE